MSLYPVKRPAIDLGSVLWIFLTRSKVAIIDREDADLAGLNWTAKRGRPNARLQSNNTSGLKGVYWSKRHEKWYAKICWTTAGTRHQKFLGFAPSREDAAKIFASAAKPIHGEFSRD